MIEDSEHKPRFGSAAGASEHESQRKDETGVTGGAVTEGINADEFEHIAEIYDQIRLLHQQYLFTERSN